MKKIIHATDFSENASKALEFAVGLSNKFNAELILLHTAGNATAMSSSSSFSSFLEMDEAKKNSIIEQLKGYAAPYLDNTDTNFKIQFLAKLNNSTVAGILETITN